MKINTHSNPMYYTPKTQDELLDFIERMHGGEKVAALTAMGLTWNFLAAQITKAQEEAEDADDLSE